MNTQLSSHLHAEFQHHSSHQLFNVQSVSEQGWEGEEFNSKGERERERGEMREEKGKSFPRMKSQSRHQALFMQHSHTELWVDPVELDGVLSSV